MIKFLMFFFKGLIQKCRCHCCCAKRKIRTIKKNKTKMTKLSHIDANLANFRSLSKELWCAGLKKSCVSEPIVHRLVWSSMQIWSLGGGDLVERWVQIGAAQIGCLFGIPGLSMTIFLFENWFRYKLHFSKLLNFRWTFPLVYWLV